MKTQHVKPPLGIICKQFWSENRVDDILKAIHQYHEGMYIIPICWVEELLELMKYLDRIDYVDDN